MKSAVPVRKVIFVLLCAVVTTAIWWTVQRAITGGGSRQGGSAGNESNGIAASTGETARRERPEAYSQKTKAMVEDYAEVRRKLQAGELNSLPPDLAPPPVPQPIEHPAQ